MTKKKDKAGKTSQSAPSSLGAALDEIGFKPLGRRIVVGKPEVRRLPKVKLETGTRAD